MAEWVVGDEITAALANQKMVYVDTDAPGNPPAIPYDGQFWVDTSTNPPTVKTYDATKPVWVSMFPIFYETQTAEVWADPVQSPVVNGTLVVKYNSHAAVLATRLYGCSNGAWINLDAEVTQVNTAKDDSSTGEQQTGTTNLTHLRQNNVADQAELTMATCVVTPTAADATIVAFGTSSCGPDIGGSEFTLRLYIDASVVASETFNTGIAVRTLTGGLDAQSAAGHTIALKAFNNAGAARDFDHFGASCAGHAVIT